MIWDGGKEREMETKEHKKRQNENEWKKFRFTLKSPLGYNKQIKTAKALIIQQSISNKKQ